ncbi:MAG TPA: hypothetical protein PLE32_20995 [Haliscomenobacter sp.]|nr:hypothetical protein [Haliscomenobacter sp.]
MQTLTMLLKKTADLGLKLFHRQRKTLDIALPEMIFVKTEVGLYLSTQQLINPTKNGKWQLSKIECDMLPE